MNLNALVDAAINETPDLAPLRPVVEKELLHYEILRALDEAAVLDKLVFQGGTSLRLCHGAPRYSEDLDFAGATPGVAARDTSRQGFCCTDDPILTPRTDSENNRGTAFSRLPRLRESGFAGARPRSR